MSQIADNLCKEICESKEIDNNDLVQICELCGSLLNLTIWVRNPASSKNI